MAGLTGAVIVLPQGVAFAAIAGLPPQYGLYTAMVTPIVAALFGSSFHLVSGPTTAISLVIFSSISNHATPGSPEFISHVLTLTFLAGVYQLAFGLARLGRLVNFVSHTVVAGFTSGAAILIVTSQMKGVLGVHLPKGVSFLHTWSDILARIGEINYYVLAIALATLVSALLSKKFFKKCPYLLVGMVVGSVLAAFLSNSTDGIRLVGKIPAHLPPLSLPDFSFPVIRKLAPEAFAVALLGLIEAVSISRAVAVKSEQRIDANQEFIGQGISNIVGCFFSSYAGSGSFTRSGVNYEAGAKTPLSAIFAAMFLVVIVLLVAPLTAYLPVAAMGGVILIVAYNLIDFHYIGDLFHHSRIETAVFMTTFFATLFFELEFAIYLGVILSILFVIAKISNPNVSIISVDQTVRRRTLVDIESRLVNQCPQMRMLRVDGPVYFGCVNYIQNRIHAIIENENIYNILIISTGISFMDLSVAEMLIKESDTLKKMGGNLYFSGLRSDVYEFAIQSKFIEKIGPSHFFDSKKQAMHHIFEKMDASKCAGCESKIFIECRATGTTGPGTASRGRSPFRLLSERVADL